MQKSVVLCVSAMLATSLLAGCNTMAEKPNLKHSINMHSVSAEGVGESIGSVTFVETEKGLLIQPNLSKLPSGQRGFHIHENPSCEAAIKDEKSTAALKAGGHFDPKQSKKHSTPDGDGHLGDLPALTVNTDGTATTPVLAPRLNLALIQGRALMIHAGGDNYSDSPEPLGGGGARIACGVIL